MATLKPGEKERYLKGVPGIGEAVVNNEIPETIQAQVPSDVIEVSVSARGLRVADRGFNAKSDPVCFAFEREDGQEWKEIGLSEVVMNNCDPDFVKKFYFSKEHEKNKVLKFQLYDVDGNKKKRYINHKNFLGEAEFPLQRLVGVLTIEEKLKSQRGTPCEGNIIVTAEVENKENKMKENLKFNLKMTGVKKGDRHYIRLSKKNDDGSFIPFHRTETMAKSNHKGEPEWSIEIGLRAACNHDQKRNLKVECLEDRNGGDRCLGEFDSTIATLKHFDAASNIPFKGKDGDSSMTVTLQNASTAPSGNFMDFVQNGMKIHLTLAIDCSKSNRPYHESIPSNGSQGGEPQSKYGEAISLLLDSLGEKFPHCDETLSIFGLGFGAKRNGEDRVSEIFPLCDHKMKERYTSPEELLKSYYKTVEQVTLAGPSNFAPVIKHVHNKIIKQNPDTNANEYHILVIFTDGAIDDTAPTKKAIAEISGLGVSIVLIGIGNNDFEAMRLLDADTRALHSNGQAIRDIVQFVEFQKFGEKLHQEGRESTARLFREKVLEEIPRQFKTHLTAGNSPSDLESIDMNSLRM